MMMLRVRIRSHVNVNSTFSEEEIQVAIQLENTVQDELYGHRWYEAPMRRVEVLARESKNPSQRICYCTHTKRDKLINN
jgi:hypothetical protein